MDAFARERWNREEIATGYVLGEMITSMRANKALRLLEWIGRMGIR